MFPKHEQQQHHGRFGGFAEEQGPHGGDRHQGLDGEGGAALGQCPRLAGDGPQPPEGGQGKQRLTNLARQQGRPPHQSGERQGLPILGEQVADSLHLRAAARFAASRVLSASFELEAGGQHGGGNGVGGEAGGQIHHQLLGGKQHPSLLYALHPADGGLYLACTAGTIHAQHLPAMAAAVLLGGRQRRLGRGGRVGVPLLMMLVVVVVGCVGGASASGGLFIPRAVCATLPLMIVAGRVGDATGLCPVVAAVAGVAVPGLWGGGLADGLDGGSGVLMAAAGFAHDAFLLRDPAPAGSWMTAPSVNLGVKSKVKHSSPPCPGP